MEKKYLDIQINGYAGVDFNQNKISIEDMEQACLKLQKDQVKGIFATVITADLQDMLTRIKQLSTLREESSIVKKMIKGIHVEGPFINSNLGYRGAHPKKHILKADVEILKRIIEAGEGLIKIVTLAPEVDDNNKAIAYLNSKNIIASAGHCNPKLDELKSAIDAGLSMFTHLGNGCPQDLPRHDNIIQRVLSLKDDLWICFITDGIHIPFYALKNYIAVAGTDRVIITTDAMAAAGAKAGKYTISDIELQVGEDRIVREPGKDNFAGSAIDMKSSYFNLIHQVGLSKKDAIKLTYSNPARVLNI